MDKGCLFREDDLVCTMVTIAKSEIGEFCVCFCVCLCVCVFWGWRFRAGKHAHPPVVSNTQRCLQASMFSNFKHTLDELCRTFRAALDPPATAEVLKHSNDNNSCLWRQFRAVQQNCRSPLNVHFLSIHDLIFWTMHVACAHLLLLCKLIFQQCINSCKRFFRFR